MYKRARAFILHREAEEDVVAAHRRYVEAGFPALRSRVHRTRLEKPPMRLFVDVHDDDAPDGWQRVNNVADAVGWLGFGRVSHLSLPARSRALPLTTLIVEWMAVHLVGVGGKIPVVQVHAENPAVRRCTERWVAKQLKPRKNG